MKQKFMKKALAVALSTAMVFSASSVAGMQSASAAAKFVGLNTTFKTLKVGQKDYKLRLVNNTQNWKIKKVATSNKKIAAVYGKKASYVLLKGKSEGRATIKVSLNTTARKKNNTKVLKCRVKVVGAGTTTPTPSPDPTPTTPSQTSKTVATQTELTAALADTTLKSITVKTDSKASFTIPAGAHTSVDLTVDAPNAEVTNSGVFKSITIAAIKDSTWTENAVGNNFKVDALKARIVVGTSASVTSVSVTKANADVAIIVNGKLAAVTISAKAKLALSGSATESVAVKIQAAGSELTADLPVAVEASADATITLQAKAEKSTVKITNTAATVTVKNNTSSTIAVTKADNKVQNVSPKGSATIKPSTSGTGTSTGSGSWGGGSSGSWGGGSSTTTPTTKPVEVYTQAELDSALKDSSVNKITILSRAEDTKLEIPNKSYSTKDLVVDAPRATITNEGTFKSIEIKNIAPETWFENAKNNRFKVSAPNPHIVVGKDAVVQAISFIKGIAEAITKVKLEIKGTVEATISFEAQVKNAEVKVEKGAKAGNVAFNANAKDSYVSMDVAGTVGDIACDAVNANVDLTVADSEAKVGTVFVSQDTTVAIGAADGVTAEKIKVELKAENAKLESAVPVDITASSDKTMVTLKESAEGSTITVTEEVKTVGVSTETNVEVTKPDGEKISVEAGDKGNLNIESGEVEKVAATGVEITPNEIALLTTDIGTDSATKELKLSLVPSNASAEITDVTWSSDDATVAAVEGTTATATVTALKEGTATITATTTIDGEEFSATCSVAITKPDDTVTPEPEPTPEGLANPSFTGGSVVVTTGQAINGVSTPNALTLTGVKASAEVDGKATDFTISDIDKAADESGITKKDSTNYEFTVETYEDSKKSYKVTATATGGTDNKYTITATGTITISGDDSNGFSASISWDAATEVTTP
jgi:hypothetical protein